MVLLFQTDEIKISPSDLKSTNTMLLFFIFTNSDKSIFEYFSLIEEYLLDNQILMEYIDIVKRNRLEMFYTYIAIQGKQKIYKNALKAQLKVNPHPLEKYRVNCPLSRLNLFRQIFDIKKGDGMWWSNTDTIW